MKTLKQFISESDISWVRKGESRYNKVDTSPFTEMKLNIKKVFNAIKSDTTLDTSSADGGKNAIGNRLERAKTHLQSGSKMDLPLLGYNEWTKSFSFIDGRHRTLAAYQLGHKKIPFLVMSEHFDKFKKLR